MKRYHYIFLLPLCIAAASQAQTTYEPFTFSTFAGAAGAAGSTDGTGSAARFSSPSGVAIDSAGNVYVADTFNNTIRKITPGAVVSTFAGTPSVTGGMDGTGAAAQFNAPIGIAVDSSDNVYVADSGNNIIRKITPGAVVTTLAGLAGSAGSTDGTGSGARFNGPRAVAVDSAFNVYVADTFNHTIRKITPGGVVTTVAGLASNPGSANGTGSAARFRDPKGIAVDTAGNIYVGDTFNDTIRKITPGGVVTTLAGVAGSVGSSDGSAAAARFSAPTALTADTSGNLFVDDTNNETIRRVRPNGFVTTVGGSPGLAGSTDGSAAAARFNAPQGITVSPDGTLFIGDTGNDTVRLGIPPSAYDFNQDGKPDYVLFNALTQQTGVWYLNNNVFLGGAYGPSLPANWEIVGVADFDGDGKPDYMLFNSSTHQTGIWYLSGTSFIGGAYGPSLPNGWDLVGVADFDRDGKPDYALFNALTQQTGVWYLNNNVFLGGAYGPSLPANWEIVGVADFDGDGKPDYMLFNSSTHQTGIWYLSGTSFIGGAYGPSLPNGWDLVGVADFDRDGKPDYALFNALTQQTGVWYLNNNVFVGGAYGPTLPANWSLIAP